jgi:Ca2+-binding RTX toxin-like protein
MKRPMLAGVAVAAVAALAPATASAASIGLTVPGGTPTIAYAASPGEVNAVAMRGTVNGGDDLRMPFFEYSAPLTVGASCGGLLPTICGFADQAFPATVALGDENDVASTNSFTQNLTMDAGSGADDVLAGGIDATADGGSGSDSIILAANNVTTGHGGSGRDKIFGGLGAAAAILTGGTGRDLLVPGGFAFNDAQGGTNADTLVSFTGDAVTLDGESGSDLLVAPTGRSGITLDGGSGSDIAFSHVGSVVVDAGSGYDYVDVKSGDDTAPDTVSCGSELDAVYADSWDDVAKDCELVIRRGTPPTLSRVTDAIDAAKALINHRPDPAGL